MFACPRCGNDADYLTDDLYTLVRCEFCGENLDAAEEILQAALDHMLVTMPALEAEGRTCRSPSWSPSDHPAQTQGG